MPKVSDTSLQGAQARGTDSEVAASISLPEKAILARPLVNAKAAGTDPPPHAQEPERPGEQDQTEVEFSCLSYADRKKKISRDKRYAWYEEIMALHRVGMGQHAIAHHLRMSRKTVKLFVSSPAFPERAPGTGLHPKGKSKLDPYLPYLRERWESGTHTSSCLFG